MKALVVDDDMSNRLLLKILLEQNGYAVTTASNGAEGFEVFKNINPDIVLMDVMMPIMDGYESTRLIKEYSGEHFVPVIVLTSLSDPEDMANAIECGADDFISKPVNHTILKAKVVAMDRLRQLYVNLTYQKYELKRINSELELLNNKILQEHDDAATLFQNVLKQNEQTCSNVKQVIVPMETCSGDIVFSRANQSGRQYLLVGDFVGHGLLAAIGSIPVSEMFNSMVDREQPISNFIPEINKKLKNILPPSVFLCASILELNYSEKVMTVWNGGMPDIFIIDKNGVVKHQIKSNNLPLGILKNEKQRFKLESFSIIKFEPDDDVYLFSDGVTETFNDKNEMFGVERLEEFFRKNSDIKRQYKNGEMNRYEVEDVGTDEDVREGEDVRADSYYYKYEPETVLYRIKKSLDDFRGNVIQTDDITMVQLRCNYESVCYLSQ